MQAELIKNFIAGGAIGENRIVRPGATVGQMVVASAASDKLMGVCCQPGGAASGERVDVALGGLPLLVLGGTVAAGDPITADANGAGVIANPAAGTNNRIIGFAYEAGVSGDFIRVRMAPGVMQG